VEKKKGMDFSNRSSQPQPAAPNAHSTVPVSPVGVGNHKNKKRNDSKIFNLVAGVLFAAVVILIVGLVVFIGFSSTPDQDKLVKSSKLQAVFLNTGQVYFGNIASINSKYFVLDNIFYLQTASSSSTTTTTSSNTNVSLVKLGCELHAPYDQMIINSDQVTFWENLQPGGQVAKAVSTWEKDHPKGQTCSDQSSAPSGSNSSTTVQGTSGTSTGTSDTTTNP
jgi:hypothetical protein